MRTRIWVVAAVAAVGLSTQLVSATTATTEDTRARDACGPAVSREDGGYYECTLVDEFDGDALDTSIWQALNGHDAGLACTVDSPQTVQVSDGSLRLTVRPTGPDLVCPPTPGLPRQYATASVTTFEKWSQQYGRFEARMRSQVVDGPGPHEAFWLWPDIRHSTPNLFSAADEIDIAETYAVYPDIAVPFLHHSYMAPVPGLNTAWDCPATRGEWHNYVLEWEPNKLTIFVDGRACLTTTLGAASYQKPFIMTFTQLLDGSQSNAYDGRVALPVTMEVDYVKVWR